MFTYTGGLPSVDDPTKPVGLDAGVKLTIAGRSGQKDLPGNGSVTGVYSAMLGGGSNLFGPSLPLYLDSGAYSVSGPGGKDIGAFGASMNIPPALTWTNRDSMATIPRSESLTVKWSGTAANTVVAILGSSATINQVGASFLCTERSEAGQFTVPPEVLSGLPPSAVVNNLSTGLLELRSSGQPIRFSASGCDVCTANYSTTEAKIVSFQ